MPWRGVVLGTAIHLCRLYLDAYGNVALTELLVGLGEADALAVDDASLSILFNPKLCLRFAVSWVAKPEEEREGK